MSATAIRYLVAGALLGVVVTVLAAALWLRLSGHALHPQPDRTQTATAVNDPFPTDVQLPDLTGRMQAFSQWHGKLLLVNFWATWCVPCRKEIPDLIAEQRRYGSQGLQIVGPAVDDQKAVRKAAPDFGFDYPILTGSLDPMIMLMARLGNATSGLPYSVLVSPQGQIIHRQLGGFESEQLDQLIRQNLPRQADLMKSGRQIADN
ncbi:MAG: redoxin family protein [Gammaproteobacteria bacterium]|nr:redoxin family protein [Gammaproteobacteria bacterium]